MIRPDVLSAIFVLGLTTYVLRAGGFFMMRYVTITPRGRSMAPLDSDRADWSDPRAGRRRTAALRSGSASLSRSGLMYAIGNEFIGAMLACGAVALVRLAMA